MTTEDQESERTRPFHVMAKPIGPICNLDCAYCFYLEKEKLYAPGEQYRMRDDVLEACVRSYLEAHDHGEVAFAWQGGEPTLMGVDFFRRAVELQRKYADGKTLSNSFQTNGTLLDDHWCEFFAANKFLIGLSIDGPRELHDIYRVDKHGKPSFDSAMRGLELLKKHGVEFNTLTVVHRKNSVHPLDVYRFLREIGSGHIQFIPLVERQPDARARNAGLSLAYPPDLVTDAGSVQVTPWTVEPRQYGRFLCTIFDEWVANDVGHVFVQLFETALATWSGLGTTLCVFHERCGAAMIIEHTGDVYSCDHYMYPEYRLGNVMRSSLADIASLPQQLKFGNDKFDTLPRYCRECPVLFACNGECPKHRFAKTPDGEPGLNYLCEAYRTFFTHIDPYMRTMTDLLAQQQPPARIMQMLKPPPGPLSPLNPLHPTLPPRKPRPNDPCPCRSGAKYKKCCGRPM